MCSRILIGIVVCIVLCLIFPPIAGIAFAIIAGWIVSRIILLIMAFIGGVE